MKRRQRAFWIAILFILSLLNTLLVCAEDSTNAYGAGLDGHSVPKTVIPNKTVSIMELSLSNPIDLTDTIAVDDSLAITEGLKKIGQGEALYLPNGVYNLKSVITLQKGKSIIGQSCEGVVLKMKEGAAGAVIKGDRITDLRLENLTLTSDWNGTYSKNPAVNNPQVGKLQYGILLYSCERVSVAKVAAEKFSIAGVALNSSTDCRIEENFFSHATDVGAGGRGYGVLLQDRSGDGIGAYYNIVADNQMTGPYLRHGVLLQAKANHNLITRNHLSDILLDAVDLHGMGEHHNEVSFNTITDGGESGIGAGNGPLNEHGASGENNYFHDNEISGCVYGVTIMMGTPSTAIEHNRILQSRNCAIRLWHSSETVIAENIIEDTETGIIVQQDGVDGGIPQSVCLTDNRFSDVKDAVVLQEKALTEQTFSVWRNNENANGALLCVKPELQIGQKKLVILGAYSDEVLQASAAAVTDNGQVQLRVPNTAFEQVRIMIWEADTLAPVKNITIIE